MKRFAIVAALLGLTLFSVLVAYSGLGDVMQAVAAAGWASAIVCLLRLAALVGAGLAWHWLYPALGRLSAGIAILLRFIREGVNQLLPVGAVGGDLVGARLATFWGADGATAGAVTIADVAIQAATQFGFALVGVGLLFWLKGDNEFTHYVLVGLAIGAVLIVAFFVVQARIGSRLVSGILRRFGREGLAQDLVDRLWRALGAVYAGPGRVAAAASMHLAMWFLGALEVYVALDFMGYPVSYAEAVVIESLGQAVRGAAFAVPGGLGVQEGGFIALCALFAVPAGPALALSLVKRVADLVLGLPFLVAWQVIEGRRAFRATVTEVGPVTALAIVCLALAGAGILYLGLAAVMVRRLAGRPVSPPAQWPAVSILKPLHGDEPGLADNLASFLDQAYPGEVQILLGVQSRQDTAIPIVEALIAAHAGRDIALVIDERRYGSNAKVSNLANLAERARHAVVVLSDSDMRVGPDYLASVIASLAGPEIGVATCPYHGAPVGSPWARLVGLGIDTHFLPGVATGIGLGIGHPCLGSTIALRRETLDAIGGFRAIADELADDHEIGRRVRALGLRVVATPFAIAHVCRETTFGDLFTQELRWVRTIRQIEPAGHLGAIASHPLPFACLALALMPGALTGGFVAGAIAARIGLCLVVERAFGLRPHAYWLMPARDLISGFVYAASFLGRSVSWRGRHFDVARSGALLPKGALPTTRSDAS